MADPKSPPGLGASVFVSPPNKPDLGASFVSVLDPNRPPDFGAEEPNGEAVEVVVALPNSPGFGV